MQALGLLLNNIASTHHTRGDCISDNSREGSVRRVGTSGRSPFSSAELKKKQRGNSRNYLESDMINIFVNNSFNNQSSVQHMQMNDYSDHIDHKSKKMGVLEKIILIAIIVFCIIQMVICALSYSSRKIPSNDYCRVNVWHSDAQ